MLSIGFPSHRIAGHAHGPIEKPAFQSRVFVALLHDIRVSLFEHPRHRGGKRGTHLHQRLREVVHALDVGHGNPVEQIGVGSDAFIYVRERKKAHGRIRRGHSKRFGGCFFVRTEIVVREHDALGLARGAGRVNNRGELVRGHPRGAKAVFGHGVVTCRGGEVLIAKDIIAKIRRRGGADDVLYRRQPVAAFQQAADLHLSRDKYDLRAGMIQDICDSIGRFVEIDGHIGGAKPQNGEIRDVPFGPVGREQPHSIAGFDAELFQRVGKPRDAPQKFGRRRGLPAPVDPQHQSAVIGQPANRVQKFFRECRVGHGEPEHYRTILARAIKLPCRRVTVGFKVSS